LRGGVYLRKKKKTGEPGLTREDLIGDFEKKRVLGAS